MARWRWIAGYEDLYQVSDQGEVKSFWGREPKILKRQRNRTGYWYVGVSGGNCGKPETLNIHVLVAEAFIGPRPNGMVIRHLDDDRNNNKLSNLRYGTHAENMNDVSRQKRTHNGQKRRCPYGHRYVGPNVRFTAVGGRYCVTCMWTRGQVERENWADKSRNTERWRAAADSNYARIMNGFVDPEPDDPMPYGADPEVLVVTMTRGTLDAAQRALHLLAKDMSQPPMIREWYERSAREMWHGEMKAESLGFKHKWDGRLPGTAA